MKMSCAVLCLALLASSPAPSLLGQGRVPAASNLPRVGAEILSDTKGIDLSGYMRTALSDLKSHWSTVAGSGSDSQHAAISLTIAPDGHVSAMRLEDGDRDGGFAKAAWSAAEATQFVALPSGLKNAPLTLRVLFSGN